MHTTSRMTALTTQDISPQVDSSAHHCPRTAKLQASCHGAISGPLSPTAMPASQQKKMLTAHTPADTKGHTLPASVEKSSLAPKSSKPATLSTATPVENMITQGSTFTFSFTVKKGASCRAAVKIHAIYAVNDVGNSVSRPACASDSLAMVRRGKTDAQPPP